MDVRLVNLALASAIALAACSTPPPSPPCANGTISRLYLGTDTPAGAVTEAQWQTFVADTVTPRFPDGFTVIDGHGQWRDDKGHLVRESTRIVEFVHDGSSDPRARVQAVAGEYKRTFSQQSVLVTQAPSTFCF